MDSEHDREAAEGDAAAPTGSFACVCRAYGPVEATFALSRLEAAGLVVFPTFQHTVSNAWHWTHALGGVEFHVPMSQVADAEALLAEFRPAVSRLGAVGLLVCMLGFLIAGVPGPASGLFPVRVTVSAMPGPERWAARWTGFGD